MDTETFLIDGYNLLHRGFGLRRDGLGRRGLAAERRRLEILVREFRRARPGVRAVLVWDGARDVFAGEDSGTRRLEIEILYSRPPESADDLILAECRRRRAAGPVVVVTSDRKDIADRLPPRGVRHLSSERFADLLDETLAAPPAPAEPPPVPRDGKPSLVSQDEVEEWLRAFGHESTGETGDTTGNPR